MIRVKTTWSGPSSPLVSTFHFAPAIEDNTAATNAHIAVATFWFTIRSHIHTSFSYTVQPEVDRLTVDGELVGHLTASNVAGQPGTGAGDPLPYQTQGLAKWRTGFFVSGREVVGHTFIPGALESDNAAAGQAGSYAIDVQAAGNAMIADANSVLAVWSRKHLALPPATSCIGVNAWRVLRGRR